MYRCAGCGAELFRPRRSSIRAAAGPLSPRRPGDAVDEETDTSYGMMRTEVICRAAAAISATCSTTGRTRPGCATASTRRRSSSTRSKAPPDDDARADDFRAPRASNGGRMNVAPPARHLLRARDLADARYFEPLGVDDLARAAGLSRAHFSREFRRAFGESPHAYLLTRRLERAAALLRTTDRSVAEICFAVGPAQRRLVHDELHAHLRHVADRLPRGSRRPPRRRWSRPASCARYGRPQHRTFREDSAAAPWPSIAVDRTDDQGATDDQDRHRPAVGARPGRGARLLHRKLGFEVRADVDVAGARRLPLAHRRARRASTTSRSC